MTRIPSCYSAWPSSKLRLTGGRTGYEIKSSIGAEPRPMRCFIRHRNPVGNRAVKPLLRFVKPTKWTPRNPFDQVKD